jgi:ATPase subunit of ABC transporter with duplicated ATPase domains
MTALSLRDVAFAHGDALPIFSQLSLCLTHGLHGVVGANGSGKTTLLQLVSGRLRPDRGTVAIEPRGAVVALCPQTVDSLDDDVRRFAEASDGEARRLRDLLRLAPAELDRWSTLSPGERRRFQLAAALHREPELLLVDEPSNHLDADARRALGLALARYRGVGLVVSHDRALLDAYTRGTVRLHDGRASHYPLPYSRAQAEWERESRARAALREQRKDELDAAKARLAEARERRAQAEAQQSGRARIKGPRDHDARSVGTKIRIGWAEGRLGRLAGARRSELARAEAAVPAFEGHRAVGRSLFVGYEPAPRSHVLRYEGDIHAGQRLLLGGVRVALAREGRVRLEGDNGAGKTSLLRRLLETSTLPRERLFFVPQELDGAESRGLLQALRREPAEVRGRTLSLVAALGVPPERLLASEAPSPGEAKKLAMAMALGRRVWALVLDEPENHLDLPAIERLEQALCDYPGALLLVSHDDRFAAGLTGERWTVRDGRVAVGASG